MKQEDKLNYTDLNWIVTALNQTEQYWIEKMENSNDFNMIKIYEKMIKEIQETEKKVKQHSCF